MKNSSTQALKILYAIQGMGNGHVARAREIIPILQEYGDVDIVLSGDQSNVKLPADITYRSKGFSFTYNKRGGVSLWRSFFKNNLIQLIKEIKDFPIEQYDVVINDFECISAWAAKWRNKKCFGLGHQVSFLSAKSPRPKSKDWVGELILKYYAPITDGVGFHFDQFDDFIQTPVIRKEIRNLETKQKGHYTVYLPAYGDEHLHQYLSGIPDKKWQVFSKRVEKSYQKDNVQFNPINNDSFIESFANCEGVLTSAGFETPAEALFLGKKLFVIPIKNQYEQYCNAAALRDVGVSVAYDFNEKSIQEVKDWAQESAPLNIHYPDNTKQIIQTQIFDKVASSYQAVFNNANSVIY